MFEFAQRYENNLVNKVEKIDFFNLIYNKNDLSKMKTREEINKNRREEYKLNNRKIKERSKEYYNKNRETINEKRKERSNKKSLEYYYKNKEIQNKKSVERRRLRMLNDSSFKLSHNIRVLIRKSLQNQFTTKSKKTIEILGCTFEEFKIYLESKFDDKMNWDNQGTYWHMDHIIPISSAETEEDVYRLNHYTNFQPLYWLDNLKKGNKY